MVEPILQRTEVGPLVGYDFDRTVERLNRGLSTLLAGTDIIATVPDYTAEALTAAGGIRAEDPPLDTQTFELHMAWRGAQDNDPGERWLRSRIQMFFGDPDSL